jgi:3-hydroxyisobutyrate dehydrogenase-like beta-hydroxyacid dehydrogenase
MTVSLGFVGLGSMGLPLTRRLLEQRHSVTVFDIKPENIKALVEKGATPATSVREVADRCDIVFGCLPNNASCRAVAIGPGGVIEGNRTKLFVNLGTTGSPLSQEIAKALGKKSIDTIDAPVTGGVRGATLGTLAVMVSGSKTVFTEIEPVLKCFGSSVTFVGEKIGVAQTMKLANNLISLGVFVLTAEAMTMGVKAGLDPADMLEVINAGTGRNSASVDKFPRYILTRSFNLGSTTEVAGKDIRLAVAEAESLGVPVWVGNVVNQFFTFALSQGKGPEDYTRLVELLEQWTGVEIRSSDTSDTSGGKPSASKEKAASS